MKSINYLPLGSIVQLEGGTQKLLIVARGLNLNRGGKTYYFDYGGVMYPQGLTGDQLAYFNHDAVRALNFIGCNDEDNQVLVDALNRYVEEHPDLVRCPAEEMAAAQRE